MPTSLNAILLLSCLLFSAVIQADDDDAPTKTRPAQTAKPATDPSLIIIDPETQQLAGIVTATVQTTQQQPEAVAFGNIVSLEPLISLRQQYLASLAQHNSARARYSEANANLARTENLHQQDIVSSRRLQEQQALWHGEKAQLDTALYQQQALLGASQMTWGKTLTQWFTDPNSKAAAEFINHQAQLLLITLPATLQLTTPVASVMIDEHGNRQHAVPASLISAAPQIDPVTQGQRYFFKSQARTIPYGSHVTVWVPTGSASNGVIIPSSAIVRHMGQNFVFIKTAANQFSRRPIPESGPSSVQAGEALVVTGAQTLLSQQLKNQIPDEDDD